LGLIDVHARLPAQLRLGGSKVKCDKGDEQWFIQTLRSGVQCHTVRGGVTYYEKFEKP